MCRFFRSHEVTETATKVVASLTIAVPIFVAIAAFNSGDTKTGYVCLGWALSSFGALTTGFFLGMDHAPYVRIGVRAEPHSLAIENAELHNMPAFQPR